MSETIETLRDVLLGNIKIAKDMGRDLVNLDLRDAEYILEKLEIFSKQVVMPKKIHIEVGTFKYIQNNPSHGDTLIETAPIPEGPLKSLDEYYKDIDEALEELENPLECSELRQNTFKGEIDG